MEDTNKYYLTDQETGERYSVTKEYYEHYQLFFKQIKQMFNPESFKGKVIIVGTGGAIEDLSKLEKLFYEPNNFKIIDLENNGSSINK